MSTEVSVPGAKGRKEQILAAVFEIWLARMKPVDTENAKYITRRLDATGVDTEKILSAVRKVADSEEQWPNLGMILDAISPSKEKAIRKELQMVFEYCAGVRPFKTLPKDVLDAAERAGSLFAMKAESDDWKKRKWEERYTAARMAMLDGDIIVPLPPSRQIEDPGGRILTPEENAKMAQRLAEILAKKGGVVTMADVE